MTRPPRQLTPKQQEFVRQYLVDLNATQAAIRAGYSARTAEWIGPQLLGKTHVAKAIQTAIEQRSTKTEITAERVLRELASIAFLDPADLLEDDGSVKLINNMPEAARRALAGLDVNEIFDGAQGDQKQAIGLAKKVRLVDKIGAIGLIMKHLGMLQTKVEGSLQMNHSGNIGDGADDLSKLTDEELQALAEIRRKLVTKH